MKYCAKCGQPVNEGQAFCKHCGNRIATPSQNTEKIPNVNKGQTVSMKDITPQQNAPRQVPKKKSKGPIIAIIILLVMIVLAAGAYFGFTIYKQSQIKDRYKEVKEAIEKGVELNDAHQNDYDDIKDAQSSLNIFEIFAAEDTADGLIAFSKVYVEGKDNLEDYKDKLDELKEGAKAAGLDVAASDSAKSISDKTVELEKALEDNNVDKIKTAMEEIPKELDTYEATINGAVEANKIQAQKNAEAMEKKYQSRYNKAVKKSKKKKVHKNKKVIKAKKAAKKALDAYAKAVKDKDATKQSSTRAIADKKIKAFEKIVSKTKKKKKWKGGILPAVAKTDGNQFTIPDSWIFPFQDSDDPFKYHSNLYDEDRYALCILAVNEIYARHGAHFTTKSLREYFKSKKWYQDKGLSTAQVKKKLSKIEKRNANVFAGWRDYYKPYVAGATGNASDFTAAEYKEAMGYYHRDYQ